MGVLVCEDEGLNTEAVGTVGMTYFFIHTFFSRKEYIHTSSLLTLRNSREGFKL